MGHIRGLDGIRALSVLAIIAFHTGLNSVPGGFYGVDSFFVLSGYLTRRSCCGSGTAAGPSGCAVSGPAAPGVCCRCGDGVHFTHSGGVYVGQRLAPDLAALGQVHANASRGGGWPGPLPPSTPSWFSNLPCQ